MCASAILQGEPWEISNAAVDPRTLLNPLVTGSLGLRFYLGIPLTTNDGHNLGTLCAIDREPRHATPDQVATRQDLAAVVMDELELRLCDASGRPGRTSPPARRDSRCSSPKRRRDTPGRDELQPPDPDPRCNRSIAPTGTKR
ncbi:GAF domain-containing protein [Kribbella qitaiheensis]|uniref:GAF domain-containing protein n=1 Tax=Kribbella qitaiheensis TaxID=1544730 RepID=UPI001FE7B5C2|nr:GAF domain-containing protein [Kribbella qitaiheensis]